MEYIINFTWDDEAHVWIATSGDIPGLVLESGSFDAFIGTYTYCRARATCFKQYVTIQPPLFKDEIRMT